MVQPTPKLKGDDRFAQSDFKIGRYAAMVPTGTDLDDVLHPEYFQNHLARLRPGMEVNVLSDDFALDCDLRVLTVTKTTAKMRVLRVYSEATAPKAAMTPSGVEVNWGGPNHKWRVVHAGEVIDHGFATKEEAEAAAEAYMAKVAG